MWLALAVVIFISGDVESQVAKFATEAECVAANKRAVSIIQNEPSIIAYATQCADVASVMTMKAMPSPEVKKPKKDDV
jgi:hypothetical protein